MNTKLQEREKHLESYGLKTQPLAVIIGQKHAEKSFAVINGVHYDLQSPIAAIDTVFKSFYALQLEYPKESLFPWILIQRRIFDVSGESDTEFPSVNTLISDLKRSSAKNPFLSKMPLCFLCPKEYPLSDFQNHLSNEHLVDLKNAEYR